MNIMPDPLAATLAAQVRDHLCALEEIRWACCEQVDPALVMAGFELWRAIDGLENALRELKGKKR